MAKLGFIGCGNMGGALAKAATKKENNEILLSNRHAEKAEELSKVTHGTVTDNTEIAQSADIIFLGVKPDCLDETAEQIREIINKRTDSFTIVSMIAGNSISRIDDALGGNGKLSIIRILPNIPVEVGEGIVLYDKSDTVTDEQMDAFLDAMSEAGLLSEMDESKLNAAGALTGCAPAFAAIFVEALADGAVECGIPRAKALEYAEQMIVGSGKYLLESKKHPGQFKDSICSPGGSTIAGVRTLEESAFRAAVINAVIDSFNKTNSLG